MANKMLIDAMHPEETRVVTVHGSKVEEFDFESASRKQLRGNIYLAKVTRAGALAPGGLRRVRRATATASSPSTRSTRTITRSRWPTGRRCWRDEARDAEEHREREERRRSPRRSARGRRAEARRRPDETVSGEDSATADHIRDAADDLPDAHDENAEGRSRGHRLGAGGRTARDEATTRTTRRRRRRRLSPAVGHPAPAEPAEVEPEAAGRPRDRARLGGRARDGRSPRRGP